MNKKKYIQPAIEVTKAKMAQCLMGASNPWKPEILEDINGDPVQY